MSLFDQITKSRSKFKTSFRVNHQEPEIADALIAKKFPDELDTYPWSADQSRHFEIWKNYINYNRSDIEFLKNWDTDKSYITDLFGHSKEWFTEDDLIALIVILRKISFYLSWKDMNPFMNLDNELFWWSWTYQYCEHIRSALIDKLKEANLMIPINENSGDNMTVKIINWKLTFGIDDHIPNDELSKKLQFLNENK